MSTGKRIAKRSIIGTRVCAPGEDGKYYSGVIQAVKTPASVENNSNCINLTPNTRYTVRFDSRQGTLGRTSAEFFESDLIGPGFQSVLGTELVQHQKCFVTFNGREISGEVMKHHLETDEVIIRIHPIGTDRTPAGELKILTLPIDQLLAHYPQFEAVEVTKRSR
ncbi:hypothetical protein HUJ04_005812 [Dendroctonus ponderosae]